MVSGNAYLNIIRQYRQQKYRITIKRCSYQSRPLQRPWQRDMQVELRHKPIEYHPNASGYHENKQKKT